MDEAFLKKCGVELDADERVVSIVRPHPLGIIGLYIISALGIIGAFLFIFLFLPEFTTGHHNIETLARLVAAVIVVVIGLILVVATYLYHQNRLIITSRSLTQVLQQGLFNRKISRLSLANIEDVTSEQRGVLANIFNYGDLQIETAGEQNNFDFSYCPDPNLQATKLQEIREQFLTTSQG